MPFEGVSSKQGFVPLCVPEIRNNEWRYIKECLDTGWVSSVGSFVERFEHMVSDYVGAKYAVATVNGTTALHVALLVGGIQSDDEVLVSTLSFIAPANAIRYIGAWPVFIDAEPDTWQIDTHKVVDFLEQECRWVNGGLRNKATGRRVKAILPVHILGHPVDSDPIVEAARKYELVVVEDAAESLGSKYKKGRKVGHSGDIACFSFNGNKIVTSGGGGMILTDNEAWTHKARYLTTQAKDDPVEYIHNHIGYNYRLSNIQAAMGCAQMENLDEYIAAKRKIAATYKKALKDVPGISVMPEAPWALSTYWMYTVLVDSLQYGMDSRSLLKRLKEKRIQTRPLWRPLHRSKAHASSQAYRIENADVLYEKALSLPCSVSVAKSDIERVACTIRSTIRDA
jgi:perosamine synthetase